MAETYHYHDIGIGHADDAWIPFRWQGEETRCSPECFDLTRSEVDANLEHESAEFRAWILGNPAVGDTFTGEDNDVALVQRVPDSRTEREVR